MKLLKKLIKWTLILIAAFVALVVYYGLTAERPSANTTPTVTITDAPAYVCEDIQLGYAKARIQYEYGDTSAMNAMSAHIKKYTRNDASCSWYGAIDTMYKATR